MFTPTNEPITRVAAIHDMSGFGRCSLTVALPTLSAMGVQCCPLPTAYLSAHTAFPNFTFLDMTADMIKAAEHWKELNLNFNALYSGFLGSEEQIDVVSNIFGTFKTNDNTLIIVDPVMGDDGKAYKTYTPGMCSRMRELADKADLITPNITEASILLGKPYESAPVKPEDFKRWLEELSGGGKRSVIITGVRPTHCRIGQVYFDRIHGDFGFIERDYVGQLFHGTGDLYASVVVGSLMHGKPLADSIELAAEFVRECCELSFGDGTSSSEGVRFESLLYKLKM
ncbi:MAG: pyridoxamine kinase [Oscillospiraceae bacterium]|nr:pyridoxamine kinase [Oscillospiraceae bacterium]